MSGTNAIHGIVLLGGLLVLGISADGTLNKLMLVIAIAFGTINIVGGFLVTDRMLEMFKGKKPEEAEADEPSDGDERELATSFSRTTTSSTSATSSRSRCSSTA